MHTISYTISPVLQQRLREIETTRQRILLHPLSRTSVIKLSWDATVSRIYFSLHLAHNMVTHKEIEQILASPGRHLLTTSEKEIVNYKRGIDFISRDWLVNAKPIMPSALQTLYKLVTEDKARLLEDELMEILVFLQTSREHTLIQSFIAYLQFTLAVPLNDVSGKVARLLPYLFLYKAGLDFRGLLVLEDYFYHNERLMRELYMAATNKESVTVWIEHFVDRIASQLEETANRLSQMDRTEITDKLFLLSERQKDILSSFDQPGARITNKKVQQIFRISQITASRDLAKLATLGLLFSYGKGRSVYYMRA